MTALPAADGLADADVLVDRLQVWGIADGLADADILVDRLQVWGIADGLVDCLPVRGVADGLASKGRQYLVGGK